MRQQDSNQRHGDKGCNQTPSVELRKRELTDGVLPTDGAVVRRTPSRVPVGSSVVVPVCVGRTVFVCLCVLVIGCLRV